MKTSFSNFQFSCLPLLLPHIETRKRKSYDSQLQFQFLPSKAAAAIAESMSVCDIQSFSRDFFLPLIFNDLHVPVRIIICCNEKNRIFYD